MPPSSLRSLSHLHIPSPIPYARSLRLQEAVLNRHWTYRDALKSSPPTGSTSSTQDSDSLNSRQLHRIPPPPTLLTFSTHPTYTVGRRHLTENPLSNGQIDFLTGKSTPEPSTNTGSSPSETFQPATFHPSPRGGLLTYHAPGQLTAYPIIDLRRFSLSARQYISLLEDVVIRTCAAFGVSNVGRSCGDPGVWMLKPTSKETTDRKICAIGVRVTRGVGSHGIGLNVFDAPIPSDLKEYYEFQDPQGNTLPAFTPTASKGGDSHEPTAGASRGYLSWGFSRIVACGLEGKKTTWLTHEGAESRIKIEDVANVFAQQLLHALNASSRKAGSMERLANVEQITEQDVLG